MKKYIPVFLLAVLSCFASPLFSQMEITDASTAPFTPENLISNIFLGDGVNVLNVTFEGDPLAVGYFKDGENAIGIDRGIILTSGRAAAVSCNGGPFGADCLGNNFASTDVNSSAFDNDLSSIANGTPLDIAKYTITFQPFADTLRFKYVFASEEYPEYSCSSFNDVFGFFISGPGINGPYSNNGENIALIPGTNTPVSINNIHPTYQNNCIGVNDQYYNDNNGIALQPVYDGYLDVFVAEVVVIPCETYTIKLMISDVGDQVFDSGVFLEAKSFGTGSLDVDAATVSLDGTITEGCSSGSVTFSFKNPVEDDFFLDYTIIGDAINGVDYEYIDSNLFIAQGTNSVTVDIVGIVDNLTEGLESIGIDIQRDICNRDTFWVYIRDNEIVPPDLGPDTLLCLGDSVQLDGDLPIPLPIPPSFSNFNDYSFKLDTPAYSPIQVIGVQPIILGEGVIQSVCVNIQHNWADDVDLFLISPSGQFIELSSDNGANCDDYNNVCFTPNAAIDIDYGFPWGICSSGEEPPFSNGTFNIEGIWSDLWDGDYLTNGTWQLLAVDDSQGFNGIITDWTITFEPLYQLFYSWSPTDGLSCTDCPDPIAKPDQTTTYTLTAWDTYGCEVYDSITIEVQEVLDAPVINCVSVTNNSITFEWSSVPGAMGYQVSIDGATYTVPNNGALSHIVTGLNLSETVTIEVFGIGNCDGLVGTTNCSTPDCSAPAISVDNLLHVDCFGDGDGSILASASGGAGDYTFMLDSTISNTTGVFDGLDGGVYALTVIDGWGCPNTISITIDEPEQISVESNVINDISCFGDNDGSAIADVTGGTAPFNYIWANGEQTETAFNLNPGIQTVEIIDNNGCTTTDDFEILEPLELILTLSSDSVDCKGASTGSAFVEIEGGTAPHLIQWDAQSGGSTTTEAENLIAGTYTVEVSDLNGCLTLADIEVFEPEGMETTTSQTDLNCFDSNDGTATVTVSGGNAPYSYQWSNNDTTQTATNLAAQAYSVVVTDQTGCTFSDNVGINAPAPIAITLSANDALCFGQPSGSIQSQVTGGTMPYTYQWDNGASTPDAPGVAAGDYCLTVVDANDCVATECITVGEASEIVLSTQTANAGCNGGSEGTIDLTTSGGTSPYSFLWSTGETTEDISGLTFGNYTVEVTDANGCVANLNVPISESDAISIDFQPINVLCFGDNTGAIDLTIGGGVGLFQFNWTGPNGFSSNDEDPSNLIAGTYNVVAEDQDGCLATIDVLITEPATAVAVQVDTPDLICFGANNGTALATGSGGTGAITYEWENGQSGAVLSNVAVGTYTVIATDENGCTNSASTIIQDEGQLQVALSQNPSSCHDGTDGEALISGVSLNGISIDMNDVQIDWNPVSGTDPLLPNLTGGETYSVVITDLLGCTAAASITIGNPTEIGALVTDIDDISCFAGSDGTATVNGNGGNPPYSYAWDANANNQQQATASNLSIGTYTVTVSDANNCSTTIQAELIQPSPIQASFQNQTVSCFGESDGQSIVAASGGTQPYTYEWANGNIGGQATGLVAGFIEVIINDGNGCVQIDSTEIIQPEEPVTADFIIEDVSCPGMQDGSINIEALGGSPPYLYSTDGINFFGNPNLIALTPGFYDITIQDSEGCLFNMPDILVDEPEQFEVDLGEDIIIPYGSNPHIEPTLINILPDDYNDYTYTWTTNNPLTPPNNPNGRISSFNAISPTTATLLVTSPNGCTAEDIINIFIVTQRSIEVPTGFSPGLDGPGLNNLLHVHGTSNIVEKINSFRIFDRWGELVYENFDFQINDTSVGWDGTFNGNDMPGGVYVWQVEVDFVDGRTESYKGHTTLIR